MPCLGARYLHTHVLMHFNVQCHRVKPQLSWNISDLVAAVQSSAGIMDVLPSGGIFRELQVVHDTGYFPTQGQPSLEEDWHQVRGAIDAIWGMYCRK